MTDTGVMHAAAFEGLGHVMNNVEGVNVRDLLPHTTLIVRTTNTVYRVVVTRGTEVFVQGGAFFPDPTRAYLDGASIGGSAVKMGWIGVGLLVEFRLGTRRIITSPVRAIATELAPASWPRGDTRTPVNTPAGSPSQSASVPDRPEFAQPPSLSSCR